MASPPKSPDTIQVVLDLDRHQLAALIQGWTCALTTQTCAAN